jgi:metal-responsive CopG/Arc/MetJ family transcriptional regulator
MRAISLKLPDDLLHAAGRHAEALGLSRAEYIRRAIEETNQRHRDEDVARRLKEASYLVREESMHVLAEFEAIEDWPDE